ncbi:MAG: response regulator, partial [Thermodesulfobacteriota bacterium]
MKPVLIAHSDPDTAKVLETAFIVKGVPAVMVPDGKAALDLLTRGSYTAVMTEKELPQTGGMDLLTRVRESNPDVRVVFISSDPTARAALEAVRAGAFDYLPSPLAPPELADCLDRLLGGAECLERREPPPGRFNHIIGQSPAIRQVFRLVDKVAATDSTVMIYGESGTGKELIARAIHLNSRRRDKPLIP